MEDLRKEIKMDEDNEKPKIKNWRDEYDDYEKRNSTVYKMRDVWDTNKKKIKKWAAISIGGILALNFVWDGFYIVPQNSTGVIKRLGEYSHIADQGMHMKIPWIDDVIKVETQTIFSEEFGFREKTPGVKSEYIGIDDIIKNNVNDSDLENIVEEEGFTVKNNVKEQAAQILRSEYLMLTGDLKMADVEYVLQYRIANPVAYVFNVRNPVKTIRDLSQSATKLIVGDASIDEVLTIGRRDIEIEVQKEIQRLFDKYDTGMQVVLYKLQSTHAPEAVRESFNKVNSSISLRQKRINEAMEEYNKIIPKAMGEAKGMIEQAEGYATERVNNSLGDVANFKQVYSEYKNYPLVTRARLYLETVPTLLKNSKQVYFIEGNDNSGLLLKKLDLDGGNQK